MTQVYLISFAVFSSLVKLPWKEQLLLFHKAEKNFVADKATYISHRKKNFPRV
jgi:hypothetical protein